MESNPTIPITKDYKVLVVCLTYNHSKYIVDALNGFAMQKTNFPFACIVIDDASTDGEPEVIKDWLKRECDMPRVVHYDLDLSDVIVVPHKSNENCTMAVYLLKRNLYTEGALKFELARPWGEHSEYIALCEGDDYWTAPEKLQIQSDCLDTNPSLPMCVHCHYLENAQTKAIEKAKNEFEDNSILSAKTVILHDGNIVATNSIFHRAKLIWHDVPSFFTTMPYDFSLLILGAINGGILFINRPMSIHRLYVQDSFCTTMREYPERNHCFHLQVCEMLKILDYETENRYHDVISARILLFSIFYKNSTKDNRKIFNKYKTGFCKLSTLQKASIISKCYFPNVGRFMLTICHKLGIQFQYY